MDDAGRIQIHRGSRLEFNSALGPYKGGLRFHPSIVKFLGFEQVFKNSLTGMPIRGGEGGSDFDPRGRSQGRGHALLPVVHDRALPPYRRVHRRAGGRHRRGPPVDRLPLRAVQADHQPLRVRSPHRQGVTWGGSLVRTEATGYGTGAVRRGDAAQPGHDARGSPGRRVVVSGSGNLATYAVAKAQQLGGRVVACSDSSGYVVDEAGTDLELLQQIKEVERAWIYNYAELRGSSRFVQGGCRDTAEEYGQPGTTSPGTNIAGFIKVADAVLALGVV